MKTFLFISLTVIIVPATFSENAAGQLPASKATEKQCEFSEIYRAEGWRIPGRLGAVPKSKRLQLETSPGGIVPGVFVTDMKANSISTLLLPKCSQEIPGRLDMPAVTVRVLKMQKVDFNGKVFAFVVDYEPQFMENGVPHGTLGFVQVVFLDVDGSGRFTVMRYNLPLRKTFLFSPDIPEWVKRASE